MFWKKDNQDSEITVNIDSDSIRKSYRLKSTRGLPVYIYINTKKYAVLDLSAGGLSFSSSDFIEGSIHNSRLYLPLDKTILELGIEVLRVNDHIINQCKFIDILEEEEDVIHKFILDYQKLIIKKKKELKKIKSQKKAEPQEEKKINK